MVERDTRYSGPDTTEDNAKEALLDELESIKGLLQDELDQKALTQASEADEWAQYAPEDGEEEIPVLREVIESIEPVTPGAPRQPSLFTEEGRPPQSRPPRPTRATGENPFLPAHIRARLQGSQPALDAFKTPPDNVEHKAADHKAGLSPNEARSALIDAIVRESLPELEAKLRERLAAYSEEALQRLAKP